MKTVFQEMDELYEGSFESLREDGYSVEDAQGSAEDNVWVTFGRRADQTWRPPYARNPLREQPYLVARRVGGREVHTWSLRQGEAVAWEQIFRQSGWSADMPLEYAVVSAGTGGGAVEKVTHWTPLRARPRASMPPMQNPAGKPPKYPWFVVNSLGRIVSGWEFKEDAKDDVDSWAASGLKFRVLARRTVIAEGINPDTWASWEKDPSRDLALKYGLRNPAGACPTCGNAYNECTCPKRNPDDRITAAIAEFPATFGLRGHEGTFRLSEFYSFISDGRVVLYTERLGEDGKWRAFAKGSVGELKREIVKSPVGGDISWEKHPDLWIGTAKDWKGRDFLFRLDARHMEREGVRVDMMTLGPWEAIDGSGGFTSMEAAIEFAQGYLRAVRREQTYHPRVKNPAGLTTKGERMYEHIKAGYGRSPRAKEIAARTVYARAGEGASGLVKNPSEWPSVPEVTRVLKDLHAEMKSSIDPDEGLEIRLQVHEDGGWAVHYGDPGYDTDHHGYWGAGLLQRGNTPGVLVKIAENLIEQAQEQSMTVNP